MKLLIMQFSRNACHGIPLRSQCYPHHHVLKRLAVYTPLMWDTARAVSIFHCSCQYICVTLNSKIRSVNPDFRIYSCWIILTLTSEQTTADLFSYGYCNSPVRGTQMLTAFQTHTQRRPHETPIFDRLLVVVYNTRDYWVLGACGSVVGWGTMLQAGRLRFRFPMRSLDFSHLT
jgi:hypothetical protein